jgi:hypothetical protein
MQTKYQHYTTRCTFYGPSVLTPPNPSIRGLSESSIETNDIVWNHARGHATDVVTKKVNVCPHLTNDHTLQSSNVTLLGCDFKVSVNDAACC